MGKESIVKKRLIKFTVADEEAIATIQKQARVSASGSVRLALRLTQLLMQAGPGIDAATLRDGFLKSLLGWKDVSVRNNKHLRITQRDQRTKDISLDKAHEG